MCIAEKNVYFWATVVCLERDVALGSGPRGRWLTATPLVYRVSYGNLSFSVSFPFSPSL